MNEALLGLRQEFAVCIAMGGVREKLLRAMLLQASIRSERLLMERLEYDSVLVVGIGVDEVGSLGVSKNASGCSRATAAKSRRGAGAAKAKKLCHGSLSVDGTLIEAWAR